ncbi:hypothetical protein P4V41_05335 [Fictibacillus nanhaiensis]|uniref:hypothetical protein n=1 Tax=Fictibacillus nanhaiensis TaxID=742169 RepID=UPI002E20EABD|nr:hypothetical protein [Fictibacillus nanhaiensis]
MGKKEKECSWYSEHEQNPVQIAIGYINNGAIAIKKSNASDNPDASAVAQGHSNASDNPENSAVAQGKSNASDNPENSAVALGKKNNADNET